MAKAAKSVGFIETMDCLAIPKIPEGPEWTYEILCGGPHKISSVAPSIMWRCYFDVASKAHGLHSGAT
jgi:hypothetical protein